MVEESAEFSFLTSKMKYKLEHIAATIIGVPIKDIPEQFYIEVDAFISTLEDFLQDSIAMLFALIDLPVLSLLLVRSLKKFTKMNPDNQLAYITKWKTSRIGLLRTGYVTLASICGWGFYVLEDIKSDIGYMGTTIGREHETPTLLHGKEPWEGVSE